MHSTGAADEWVFAGRQCERSQLRFSMTGSAKNYMHTQAHTLQECMCIYGCPDWLRLHLLVVPPFLCSFSLFLFQCIFSLSDFLPSSTFPFWKAASYFPCKRSFCTRLHMDDWAASTPRLTQNDCWAGAHLQLLSQRRCTDAPRWTAEDGPKHGSRLGFLSFKVEHRAMRLRLQFSLVSRLWLASWVDPKKAISERPIRFGSWLCIGI